MLDLPSATVRLRTVRSFSLLILFIAGSVRAQDVTPCAAFVPKPCAAPEEPAAKAVARVDGESILLSDLDEATRKKVDGLAAAIADARRTALRAEIDETLFALEASRRGVTTRDLLYTEVLAKTKRPTEEDIAAEIAAHPEKYKRGKADSGWAGGSLFDARFEAQQKSLIAALEQRFPVRNMADAGTSSDPAAALASVGPHEIKAAQVVLRLATAEADVRIKAGEAERTAVELAVHNRLFNAEAARRGVPAGQLIRDEVTSKVAKPTEAELKEKWLKWKVSFDPDFEKARPDVVRSVERDKEAEAEKVFEARLRSGHKIEMLFDIPKRPAQPIDIGASPASGDRDALVTVVEWGDFQCPPCGYMAPIVDEALRPYGSRVRYVFKHYPNSFHEFAWKAAEAAEAAHAQKKFFPYAHLLFANQKALDVASLKKYAKDAGLDAARFDRDLDSGRYAAEIMDEKRQGDRAGVSGTPMFFVNGDRLGFDGYSVEGLRAVIDKAMSAKPVGPATPASP